MLSDFALTKLRDNLNCASEMVERELSERHSQLSFTPSAREERAEESHYVPENYYHLKWLDYEVFVSHDIEEYTKIIEDNPLKQYRHVYSIACRGFTPKFKYLDIKGNTRYKAKITYYGKFYNLYETLVYFRYAIESLICKISTDCLQNELW